jgi:hypothetical protein
VSLPEAPAQTDIERVLANQQLILERLDRYAEALNGLGQNVQWMVENVQGIFQMFSNPAFLAQLPQMFQGGQPDGG